MHPRFLSAAFLAVLACSLGVHPACADVYTWVDSSGTINISNLSPPEGVRVTNVTRETPQSQTTREDFAREAARQAELQALADRVRQLENEVEVARRSVPPPQLLYVPVQAPPPPPPVQYQVEMAPASGGCDPSWASCWGWWGSAFYPASVVVVRTPRLHRFSPGHPGHRLPVQRPVGSLGGFPVR